MRIKQRTSTPLWLEKFMTWVQSNSKRPYDPWYVMPDQEQIPEYPKFRSHFHDRFVTSFTHYDNNYWVIQTEEQMTKPSYRVRISKLAFNDPMAWVQTQGTIIGEYKDSVWEDYQLTVCSTIKEMNQIYWERREHFPSCVLEGKL